MTTSLVFSGDLAGPYIALALALGAVSLVLLGVELLRGPKRLRTLVALTGAASVIALLAAVLRPARVATKRSTVGQRVVVLVDGSRSMDLPGVGGTRREAEVRALTAMAKDGPEARRSLLSFGDGPPRALGGADAALTVAPSLRSDLTAALETVSQSPEERPSAVIVLSDGRLDRPAPGGAREAVTAAMGSLKVPIHVVALAKDPPADASIRAVKAAGAAVAHQTLSLRVDVGCAGGLVCGEVPITARELRDEGEPRMLAQGTAKVVDGAASIDLPITLDRSGVRIVEVKLRAPSGDTVAANDTRYVTINVARDRVRVLHVAGRPTYDVRALRTWLKSDASVDVVAFFILRTPTDEVNASQNDLALIPFPVDELFSEHLSSFDAVVLQDFNAAPYGLAKYLDKLASYVEHGGGLIMVGGPDAFVSGNYAGTPLARVLPVDLDHVPVGKSTDLSAFVPRTAAAGASAPVLAPLRSLVGDAFPEMPGTNVVGDAHPSATVLLEHPRLKTPSGAPMPVLALGEQGSGRTIALTVDGSHELAFSAFASGTAGRAHGAFWDALLGWLMRDPRFEPGSIELPGGCVANAATTLTVRGAPASAEPATLTVRRLGTGEVARVERPVIKSSEDVIVEVGELEAGGYSATLELAGGAQSTRRDFACETGGDEWADTRPDLDRLRAIADATGGKLVYPSEAASLPLPEATSVTTERRVAAIAPPWVWTLCAAALLGVHWLARRRSGLS